jgi:hypothetical protein
MKRIMSIFFLTCLASPSLAALKISSQQAREIGKKVWMNECAGTIDGLTSWNEGEEFASLGIGHFIWCPKGKPCPFAERFPQLISFLKDNHVKLPAWLKHHNACPWSSRKDFLTNLQNPRMLELRTLLADTIDLQTRFIMKRLEQALPNMLRTRNDNKKAHIKKQFQRLEQTPQGIYALVDYVNFKGEGCAAKEKYNGQGWGLLHVLEQMNGTSPLTATEEFVSCAKKLLTQRVTNAPASRNEARWLPGWKNRLDTYIKYVPS